ncbi:hypothetical protein AB1I62_03935 [Enterococcus sp. AN402]|uniref:hypothetical protein n=1 Tax=Enterococcus sp. AN402 TaxID=3151386 RepID=UPI003457B54B
MSAKIEDINEKIRRLRERRKKLLEKEEQEYNEKLRIVGKTLCESLQCSPEQIQLDALCDYISNHEDIHSVMRIFDVIDGKKEA